MKILPTKLVEVENEGLISLLGKQVEIRCNVYIYAGILTGVGGACVKLEDAAIVYETGAFSDAVYKDAQRIGNTQFIFFPFESCGECSKKY